ncbi:MAG: GntR family transcriptional regulator [Noviherbaspirillum sp.]|nr:GntR family transcriptional regulator [Noviherbaspirillum sp.]
MSTPIPISRDSSQTDRAILGIRDLVLRGTFQAGERLSEVDLAERLGVSRTPIRAALQRLREEGLLELSQPTGYMVRGFSESDIYDAIEVRGTIEALAARMAAERGVSRLVLDEMKDCLTRIDDILARGSFDVENLNQYAAANARFHALMMDAAGSDIVKRSLARVVSLPFASPNAFVLVQAKIPGSIEILKMAQTQHRDIVDAIESRAGARVEALVKEHARIARKNLELALRNADALRELVGAPLLRPRAHMKRHCTEFELCGSRSAHRLSNRPRPAIKPKERHL